MRCKKCGCENLYDYWYSFVKENDTLTDSGQKIPEAFKGFSRIPRCSQCGELFHDYMDFSVREFMRFLNSSDTWNTRKIKGKAFARYFGLDNLFELKRDE